MQSLSVSSHPAAVQNLGVARVCPVLARLYGLRQDTAATLARTFDTDTAGVLQASLLGLRHTLSKDTAERFRAGGTFHILVISGFQITVLGLLARWLVRRVTRRRGWQFAGAASFIWLYALMVGGEVSVVRAALRMLHRPTA